MLVKRKLYSVMDEEGNLGYYLYDENSGEERLFAAVKSQAFKRFIKVNNPAKSMRKSYEGMKTSLANAKEDLVKTYKTKYADKVGDLKRSADNYVNSYIDSVDHMSNMVDTGANTILNAKGDLSRVVKNLRTGKYNKK